MAVKYLCSDQQCGPQPVYGKHRFQGTPERNTPRSVYRRSNAGTVFTLYQLHFDLSHLGQHTLPQQLVHAVLLSLGSGTSAEGKGKQALLLVRAATIAAAEERGRIAAQRMD